MTNRFAHLSALHVKKDATATYTLYQIDCPEIGLGPGMITESAWPAEATDESGKPLKHPVLVLRPAGEENKPYWAKVLKHSGKNARRLRGGRIDPAVLEETREHDLALFPEHVVVGWKGVFTNDGEHVPYSKAACGEFLRMLPTWIFNEIRNHASEPTNYLPEDAPSAEEIEEQGNV